VKSVTNSLSTYLNTFLALEHITFSSLGASHFINRFEFSGSILLSYHSLLETESAKLRSDTTSDRYSGEISPPPQKIQPPAMSLLRLSTELRLQILDHVIDPNAIPYAKDLNLAKGVAHPNPNLAIAYVNNQLNREAMSIVHSRVTFTFLTQAQLRLFFAEDVLNDHCLIRNVRLELDLGSLLLFVQARPTRGYGTRTSNRFWGETFPSAIERLELRRICIQFPDIYTKPMNWAASGDLQAKCNEIIWIAGSSFLSKIAVVDFQGSISDTQKNEWLDALKKGEIPEMSLRLITDGSRPSLKDCPFVRRLRPRGASTLKIQKVLRRS